MLLIGVGKLDVYWSLALCLLIKLIFCLTNQEVSSPTKNSITTKHHNFNPTQRVFGTPLSQHKATPIPCFLGVHLIPNPPLKSKNICTSFPLQPTKNNEQKKYYPEPNLSFLTLL